jgi:hypothetical protein
MEKTRDLWLRIWVIGSALLMTSAMPAFSQQPGTVRGNAKDAAGQPLPHAMVRLITDLSLTPGKMRTRRYMAISDSFGNYNLDGVEPGSYVAMVFVDGKATKVLQSVTLRSGESTALNFALVADDRKLGER